MRVKISQLLLPLDYEDKDILKAIASKLNCSETLLSGLTIIRRSIDARKRRETPVFSIHVEIEIQDSAGFLLPDDKDIQIIPGKKLFPEIMIPKISGKATTRPVVIGSGPSGLMAALTLAEAGLSPLLIERGSPVKERTSQVALFWKKGD